MTSALADLEGAVDAFLGVEQSLTGCRWQARGTDGRTALALAQRHGLPEVVGRVLAARGIDVAAAEGFLNPTLRDHLPDPSALRDMDQAAERLAQAVMAGEQVAVFGDYDVDGATSTALLMRFLGAVGSRCRPYIPDRQAEGYGPNIAALRRLQQEGASLVVTVDCGIAAFDTLAEAGEAGLDAIVVDHHEAEPRLPPAQAVVNPNRLDEDTGLGHMAAVGVAFLLVVATNRALRAAGWYEGDRREPDLRQWLDVVALGTVCDVVPLTGVNRALVGQGLKVMARRNNAGLRALADVGGVRQVPDAYHLGFVLGPRVNAGGRVGEAELGTRLLATDDGNEAAEIAKRLDGYNKERQEIEAAMLQEAMEMVEGGASSGPLIFAAGEGWHPGVIGIVAGRLKERYNRPACVVSIGSDGLGKGSGRSIAGLDLGAAVLAARQEGLLENGGGHAMAAGFTVAADKLDAFRDFVAARLADQVEGETVVPRLTLDGAVDPRAVTADLVRALEHLAPFGAGNAQPRFALPEVTVQGATIVGMGHVKCTLVGPDGGRVKAMAFRSADSSLGTALLASRGRRFHVAGTLRPDNYQGGDSVQVIIEDVAYAE